MFRAAGFPDSDESSEFDYSGEEAIPENRNSLNSPTDLSDDDFDERYLKFFWKRHRNESCNYITSGEILLDDLRLALKNDNLHVVEKLFKSGVSLTSKLNERGWTCLDYAVFYASNLSLYFILSNFKCTNINADVQVGGFWNSKEIKILQCMRILNDFGTKYSEEGRLTPFDHQETRSDDQCEKECCSFLDITHSNATSMFLGSIQLSSLIPLFKNYPFQKFLQLNDEDLQKMGVLQFGYRKQILGAIDQFYKCPWTISSLGLQRNFMRKFSGEDLYTLIKNLKYQLEVMASSTYFVKRLINDNKPMDQKILEDIAIRDIKTRKNVKNLYDEVLKFRKIIEKVCEGKLVEPPHLIKSKPKQNGKIVSKWLFVVCLSLLGTLIWCKSKVASHNEDFTV